MNCGSGVAASERASERASGKRQAARWHEQQQVCVASMAAAATVTARYQERQRQWAVVSSFVNPRTAVAEYSRPVSQPVSQSAS